MLLVHVLLMGRHWCLFPAAHMHEMLQLGVGWRCSWELPVGFFRGCWMVLAVAAVGGVTCWLLFGIYLGVVVTPK